MGFFRFPFKLEGVWVRNQFVPPSHFGEHQVGPSPVICYLNLNQNTVYLKKKERLKFAPRSHFWSTPSGAFPCYLLFKVKSEHCLC